MKIDTTATLRPDEARSVPDATAFRWRTALLLVSLAIVAILAIYRETAESIVSIWSRSETFAHGYLIFPISVWLAWRKRNEVARLPPSPDYLGFMLLAGLGFAWLAAAAGQVQVVQQYAMVAMIPASIIAIAGRRVAGALAFPLGFLLLCVPVGEVLIPPLMDWTADFTVTALVLSGLPVFREGNFFTIPSGHWSVVEGCSGLRYLIASITVGALFAYLSYRKTWKRLLFVALSVIVPVIANGLRAYMIVMIAHLSDMKLALGVDHLIYGWLFFGVVMLVLFSIGARWRDDEPVAPTGGRMASRGPTPASPRAIAGATAGAILLAAVWPLYAAHLDRSAERIAAVRLDAPAAAGGWSIETEPVTDWRPRYGVTPASIFQTYRKGNRVVALYIGFYPQQRRGSELVTSTNVMVVQKHPVWSNMGESPRKENLAKGPVTIRETRLRSNAQRLLIWDYYRISGYELANPYLAKLLLSRNKLLDRGDAGAAIVMAAPYDQERDAAADTLREFARDMAPSIEAALARAENRVGAPAP